ncbi:transferase [Lithospermum erythrorhizon]|uniref:Glycosyltransferase n=1 Tax=Lithospermum erythrorhizon TaxID=34254 RepID=A0AAV3R6M6_LITER
MNYRAHVLAVPIPGQGHLTPMLQLCKQLVSKGLKVTVALTRFVSNTTLDHHKNQSLINYDTISDGFDTGGYIDASSVEDYFQRFQTAGTETLTQLIKKQESLGHKVDCIIYDGHVPWALNVAKQFGILGAVYFTQPCAVDYVYYLVNRGLLTVPVESPCLIPGLPSMELKDIPAFVAKPEVFPGYFQLAISQFTNVDEADFVLVNTFYDLEDQVVDAMSKYIPLLTIGPTVPLSYLDKQVDKKEKDYGYNLFNSDSSVSITNWLSTKPIGSVIYVSFGSMADLDEKQMEELAFGLKQSDFHFIWVVRESEQPKLPKEFLESEKGMIVNWCSQLDVLSSEAVGCFFTHGGWNSITEAMSLVVPMVVMPRWTDQTTNAKFVEDVWKVGVRVNEDEDGFVRREEIEKCIKGVMEKERNSELKKSAMRWKELAKEALSIGGSSYNNIEAFVSQLTTSVT